MSVRTTAEKFIKTRVISGYDAYLDTRSPRRALLSYLVHPLLLPRRMLDPAQFSNQGMAREIPRVLNELGFVVDMVDYTNMDWTPRQAYDLFVGHSRFNFVRLADLVRPSARVLYFSTGVHWRQQNTEAAKRLYDVAVRRGVLLPPERINDPAEGEAYEKADAIICLGNQRAAQSFSAYQRVHHLNNAAYPINGTPLSWKDFAAAQKHFLFFSGLGNVHKGLDLLLEAFVGADCHLHVCQRLQPEFARAYRAELTGQPNIHVHGFVKMRTPEFERLAAQCNHVILPTCAEGQPGSVLECMAYGLAPILPDAANIDLEDFGFAIPALNVDAVRSVIHRVSELEPEECRRRAQASAAAVARSYSVENFRANLKSAIEQTLSGLETGARQRGHL